MRNPLRSLVNTGAGSRREIPLLAAGFALLVTVACAERPSSLVLLDSVSRTPVPGALVYSPGEMTVHRSDVRGVVALPAGYGDSGIRVFAKNYQPFVLSGSAASDEALLTFDESLVNPVEARLEFGKADTLRGSYGPYRENNDLLSYDLNITVDVEEKFLSGWNTIRFRMLEAGSRIQLDLFENMTVEKILLDGAELAFSRDFNAVFVDFPMMLTAGEEYSIDFHYSGHPVETGRFGGFTFAQDSLGNPWIFTANQGIGASLWWPNKDQQPDEVEEMTFNVTVPSSLVDASNGRLMEVRELSDGFTEYRWKIHYPINNYSVSVNVGAYTQFSDTLGDLTLDFYALPYHLEEAREQFAQAKPMLQCFSDRFGDFPFMEDGYKLIEVPYSGMEHQSAVTYGNLFRNGYLGRDWTGVDISTRFDFIIIHESGHEWFGNSVTANDVSDAWIHEGWNTWAEAVYVECLWGYEDAMTYINGYKAKVGNRAPIIGPTGVNHWPTQDQYFKGALFMNTLRHVVDDDEAWWRLIKDYTAYFKYQNIWTTDVINFFNARLGRDFRPIFQQYLYYPSLPVLQVRADGDTVSYRWQADVEDFDMPLRVRFNGSEHTIRPSSEWTSETLNGGSPEDWLPAVDLFYFVVERM
ncbi:MAG: M1 family metallopeptidase [Gemmatimonadota bacterium]